MSKMTNTKNIKPSAVVTTKLAENKAAKETVLKLDPKAIVSKFVVGNTHEVSALHGGMLTIKILQATTENDPTVVFAHTDELEKPMSAAVTVQNGVETIEAWDYQDHKAFWFANQPLVVAAPVVAPEETSAPQTAPASKTKTQGIFQITSKFDPSVVLKGASSQIEICTRDYMSWCLKDKAPKTMQVEYDKQHALDAKLTPAEIFEVTILKVCPTTTDLKNAKAEYGLLPSSKADATPAEPKKPSPLMVYAQIRACQKFAAEFVTTESTENAGSWSQVAVKLEEVVKLLDTLTTPAAV